MNLVMTNQPESVVECRLQAVVSGDSVRLQAELPLQGKGIAPGSLAEQPVLRLSAAKDLIAPALPPLHHITGGANKIFLSGFPCLQCDLAPDILRSGAVQAVLFQEIPVSIPVSVSVGSCLE